MRTPGTHCAAGVVRSSCMMLVALEIGETCVYALALISDRLFAGFTLRNRYVISHRTLQRRSAACFLILAFQLRLPVFAGETVVAPDVGY